MPKTLDVLIGLATIMLCFSLGVTVVTQAAVSISNRRGKCLLYGIERLLRQIWPDIGEDLTREIAQFLLKHPLIATHQNRLASVLQREEMVVLLLEAAAGESSASLDPVAKNALCVALAKSGIADPSAVLAEIRLAAQDLEKLRPELAASERRTMAILKVASGPFTAKLFGWFDQTIDRVTERFTAHAHVLSVVMAALITFIFQLDAIWIIQRLSSDDATRTAIVAQAQLLANQYRVTEEKSAGHPPSQQQIAIATYDNLGLIQTPAQMPWREWIRGWGSWHRMAGGLLSVLLLSLGAPFWYNVLQNFVRFKSVLSGRDDEQRHSRQSLERGDGADSKAVDSGGVA